MYTFSEEADATPHEQSRRDHTASVPLKQREACTYTGANSMLFGYVLPVPRKLHSHTMNYFFFFFFGTEFVKENGCWWNFKLRKITKRDEYVFVCMLKLLYNPYFI